ncbi:UDP-glycosyltransferase 76E1-like [Pistacia vera]|uniref:UDP-glycosyltransferase 76E1-like n=1 Tax=Pistacia vera TaxID=55513 RepID=UPI001263313C|nr:UDP-glycosyltransferase 76E1-like [Pistacia vera]
MEKQGWRCRKLVLVPCPFQGHINPMLQLGTILHSRGFSITVAHAQFNSPQTSNQPDFIFQSLPDGISSKPDIARYFLAFMSSLNLNCRAPFQEFLSQMIGKQEQQDELPCIIYDALMYILQTCSVTTMLTYFAYPRLQEEGYIPPQDSNSTELVPGLHLLRFKDLPSNTFDDLDPTLQLIAILSNIGSSSAIVWDSMDCLEQSSLAQYQQQFRVPNLSIGPMHKIAWRPLVAYWKRTAVASYGLTSKVTTQLYM